MADTLEQLWISYNNIEKLKGIAVLKKLTVRSHSMFKIHCRTFESVRIIITTMHTCMQVIT